MHSQARSIDSSEALPSRLSYRQLGLRADSPPVPIKWLESERTFRPGSHGKLLPISIPQEDPSWPVRISFLRR